MNMKKFIFNEEASTCPNSYSESELETIVMVYDALIDWQIEGNRVGIKNSYSTLKLALFTALIDLQDNEGVAGFRSLARVIGLQLDRSLTSLKNAGLLEGCEFVWDLETVPNVIEEVHARFESFPYDVNPWFVALCDELGIADPRKAYQVTNDTPLTFERVRDQLPFMADLLRDTGGVAGNPKLFKDFQTALRILAGTMYANGSDDYISLLEFILEAEGKGANRG